MHNYLKVIMTVTLLSMLALPIYVRANDLSGKYLYCKTFSDRKWTQEHHNHTFFEFVSEKVVLYTSGLDATSRMFYTTKRNPSEVWFGFLDPTRRSVRSYGSRMLDRKSLVLTYEPLSKNPVKQRCKIVSPDDFSRIRQQLVIEYTKDFKL